MLKKPWKSKFFLKIILIFWYFLLKIDKASTFSIGETFEFQNIMSVRE